MNHIKKLIEKALDACLLPIKPFQDYVNSRYSGNLVQIPNNKPVYVYYDGLLFNIHKEIGSLEQVLDDYDWSDMRDSDVVLDIGANIGAFSLIASKKTKRVYAVEPVFSNELKSNTELNRADGVYVMDIGLGEGTPTIEYDGIRHKTRCFSLSKIIKMCGGRVDFLKLDCEGAEWYIKPEELKGIRRIEAEVHVFDGEHVFKEFRDLLDVAGFVYTYKEYPDSMIMLIHAIKK